VHANIVSAILNTEYQALLRPNDAITDYSESIKLIEGPGGELADPEELPAS
jgi:hypothetical protein